MAGNYPHVRIQCKAIKRGRFAEWTGAELKVWLALKAHQNGKDNEVWPSLATLRRCTGLRRASVCVALRGLLKRKEIWVREPGGPIESTHYDMLD